MNPDVGRCTTAAAVLLISSFLTVAPPALAQEEEPEPIPQELLRGREVWFDHLGVRVEGELLAASGDTLWVEAPGLRAVPLADLALVSVRKHRLDGRKAGLWTFFGGLVTGAALTGACLSVDDTSCGPVLPIVLVSWGVVGGLASLALHRSSRMQLAPDPRLLRPFARFPQGLPEGYRLSPAGAP